MHTYKIIYKKTKKKTNSNNNNVVDSKEKNNYNQNCSVFSVVNPKNRTEILVMFVIQCIV